MTVSLISGHRRVAPYGMVGGCVGDLGRGRVEHADGRITDLRGCDTIDVLADDELVIETPGGGGYGPPAAPAD
jgi:5-oxoprolinase (ATP-hydrolysing)